MTAFDSWESYLYPETLHSARPVMVNKLGIRDSSSLSDVEYALTHQREIELRNDPGLISRTFNSEHLQSIHAYLFQDVYEWAGQYRTVDMFKGNSGFALTSEIDSFLAEASLTISVTNWSSLNREKFAEQAATVFAYVNQAHPFREGNGRTSKMFMEHVAELSPYRLSFSRVNSRVWNRASELSSMRSDGLAVDHEPLIAVFKKISQPRQPIKTRSDLKKSIMAKLQAKMEARESKQGEDKSLGKPSKPRRDTHGQR